jgi:hypothetical protein
LPSLSTELSGLSRLSSLFGEASGSGLPSFSGQPSGQPEQHDSDVQRPQNRCNGQPISILKKPRQCTSCKSHGRIETSSQKQGQKRQFGELSSAEADKRSNKRQQLPRTLFMCNSCNIAICNNPICWERHIKKMRGFFWQMAEKIGLMEGWLFGLFWC